MWVHSQNQSGSQVVVSTLECWIVLQTLFPGQWDLPVRAFVQGRPEGPEVGPGDLLPKVLFRGLP